MTQWPCTTRNGLSLLFVAGCLLLWSCALTPEVDLVVHDSPRGSVYLERSADRSFQAAHPVRLEHEMIARALRGVQVQDEQGLLQTLVAGQSTVIAVFSEDDIVFLTPLLIESLGKAAPDQHIGFRIGKRPTALSYSERGGTGIGSSEPPLSLSTPETTAGTLYVYGRSLYLTLTQYRVHPERPDTVNMANRRLPDSTGLTKRKVLFAPEIGRRPDGYRTAQSTKSTLVIDYELLASLPAYAPAVAQPDKPALPEQADSGQPSNRTAPAKPGIASGPPQEELRAIKEQMDKKNSEVEELRKELQDIRRQLGERDAEKDHSKWKSKPATKTPEIAP